MSQFQPFTKKILEGEAEHGNIYRFELRHQITNAQLQFLLQIVLSPDKQEIFG